MNSKKSWNVYCCVGSSANANGIELRDTFERIWPQNSSLNEISASTEVIKTKAAYTQQLKPSEYGA